MFLMWYYVTGVSARPAPIVAGLMEMTLPLYLGFP